MATRKAAAKKTTAKKIATKKPATKKAGAKKAGEKKAGEKEAGEKKAGEKKSTTPPSHKWSAKVKTDSTKPGPGLFKKSAKRIAERLVSKEVSPEGPGQAMRMLNFYENRGGKNLPAERKQTLEQAKKLIHEKVEQARPETSAKKSSGTKAAVRKSVKS